MTGPLFETPERAGNLWRLEVVTYQGRTFANWRMWWRDKESGELKPGGKTRGVTFPPERLSELRRAIGHGKRTTCQTGRKTAPSAKTRAGGAVRWCRSPSL